MIIGITGTIGAGKSTAVSYLEKKGFRHVSLSGYLAEEARRRGEQPTRPVLRRIGNKMRKTSDTALVEQALGEYGLKDNVAVESLHTIPEIAYVKGLGGKVIAIDAPLSLRWERVQSRGGEKDASYDAFLVEQNRQMSSSDVNENNLASAIEAADFHIENAGTEEELFQGIDAILSKFDA